MADGQDVVFQPEFESAEEELLHHARHGCASRVLKLVVPGADNDVVLDINCKGKKKFNRGWTPLHLASYFGHYDTVKILLQNGADLNVVNTVGDTPLHQAAHTAREQVLTVLLEYGANVTAVNSEGHQPRDLARNPNVRRLIEAAEVHESKRHEEEFLQAAAIGNMDGVSDKLQKSHVNINCIDRFGNTALHIAALRDKKEAAVFLLQNGINTAIKNNNNQLAADMARTQPMRQLLGVRGVKALQLQPQRFEGQLLKKSRILGFRPVWVIVERGVLAYFENRGDASTGSKRKGMKYLDEAKVYVPSAASREMKISFSDGTTHTLSADPADGGLITKQKWLNALTEHIGFSTHYTHQGEAQNEYADDIVPLGTMQEALQTAQAHQKLLERQVKLMSQKVEQVKQSSPGNTSVSDGLKSVHQEVVSIQTSSQDMCTSLAHCMTLFSQQEEIRQLQLKEEMEKSRVLQEALHALATEHHELEKSISSHKSSIRYYDTDDDEFYDCSDDGDEVFGSPRYESFAESFTDALSQDFDVSSTNGKTSTAIKPWARVRLPVPMFSRQEFSIWSILKQCIGKELSKITMPVIFNEPISFIQRISEYMEYSYLLDEASRQADPVKRMQYVAAFAVSAISSNWERIGKPFNPLLGETYELERPDLGYKLVGEQVSHHPPVSAIHVTSPKYTFHGSINPKLKFWGKSVEINPKGTITLELKEHNEVYTWQNVNCCVHNIIVGKLWVEHYGTMEVTNHSTKHKAVLNFKQGGWFGKDLHKVEGFIYDSSKRKCKAMYGNWVLGMYSCEADTYESFIKNTSSNSSPSHNAYPKANGASSSKGAGDDVADDIPSKNFQPYDLGLPGQLTLWRANPRPEDSHKYFCFTSFSMGLNELREGMQDQLPPTDSRLRPDMKLMEDGNIDAAALEKNRLEEKQRAARKDRKKTKKEWTPLWFEYTTNPATGKEDWMFKGDYWRREWTACADIF
ncbi:oxysterol-binding protein-related protein 1-like [Haliotis rufescens]|uniref:oxysterol-binding protein-related protein 1-like n=1 Tax=Haliotis rufescens TaxID=6454 RepID=UPI00201E8AF3|nr:oxysterol-binding protein-related protein 1-like [Haliotis rufescens]